MHILFRIMAIPMIPISFVMVKSIVNSMPPSYWAVLPTWFVAPLTTLAPFALPVGLLLYVLAPIIRRKTPPQNPPDDGY